MIKNSQSKLILIIVLVISSIAGFSFYVIHDNYRYEKCLTKTNQERISFLEINEYVLKDDGSYYSEKLKKKLESDEFQILVNQTLAYCVGAKGM